MNRIPDGTPSRAVRGCVHAVFWKLLTRLRRRPARAARRAQSARPGRPARAAHKYQALVAPLPRSGQGPADGPGWPATWRGVARAGHARQLLTALVTTADGMPPRNQSPLTVTMVVVGPGDCLDVGDDFTLWQGSDVARGVVTRRLFI